MIEPYMKRFIEYTRNLVTEKRKHNFNCIVCRRNRKTKQNNYYIFLKDKKTTTTVFCKPKLQISTLSTIAIKINCCNQIRILNFH